MGEGIAEKFGEPNDAEERDLTPEEMDKHGEAAAKHFAESMARHDHAGMFAAFKAMDALCEEQMDEEEPGEE